jgi:CheY-like chemotaxis protein
MNPPFAPNENKRWLIVDDNRGVLAMMSAVMQNLTNAEVEFHHSPQAALAAFAAAPEKYELVVTDYEMPGMDGVELCRRLRALAPAQKVFLTTGSGLFTDEATGHAGFSGLLNKPFQLEALLDLLNAVGIETRTEAMPA